MKLHKILLRHCPPKDSVEVTKLYVLADSEAEIRSRQTEHQMEGV